MFSNFLSELPSILLSLPVILLALSFHEMSHAYVADRLGDPTAKNLGRLTLNPAKHLNPIGFICMLLFHIGWANPVPINTRNFKNPRRDMALSSLAGPLSNVLLGILSAGLLRLALLVTTHYFSQDLNAVAISLMTGSAPNIGTPFLIVAILTMMLYLSMIINFSYAIFNLLPIPPWDGSRIFYVFLPPKWYFGIMKYERIILLVMLVLLWTGALTLPLSFIVGGMEKGMFALLGMRQDSEAYRALAWISQLIASLIA